MSGKFQHIKFLHYSDTGLVRPNNEDAYSCLPDDGCFFVSDGMGGGSAGEIASQIVEDVIADAVSESANESPGLRKYTVQQAIQKANQKILQYAKERCYEQMGATLALLLLDSWNHRKISICHIGDSRIYRYRDGVLTLLTRDHTVGNEMREKADIPFAVRKMSALSHILTRAIGTSSFAMSEWQETEALPGDFYLLCSDGVSSMLSDADVASVFTHRDSLENIKEELIGRVNKAGAADNFTFILLRIADVLPEDETHAAEEWEESKYLEKISSERIDCE